MSVLFPRLPFDPSETSWSYASRLAALHTGGDLRNFAADFGLSVRGLRAGTTQDSARLAEVGEVEPDVTARATIRSVDGRYRLLRNEPFSVEFIPTGGIRVCPLCLLDDQAQASMRLPRAAWRQRIAWRLRPIASCVVHGVGLVDVSPGSALKDMPEFRHAVAQAGGPQALVERLEMRPTSRMEHWVHARLEGHPQDDGPWLPSQTIEQGVRACRALGAELLFGRHRSLRSGKALGPEEWNAAGARGLDVARGGEKAIGAALDTIRSWRVEAAVQAGPETT